MRRIVTAITAAAMALSLVSMATPAAAVAGYDSAYAGESAFLTLNAGQSGTFTVFFQNTGTTSWAKGTASQVDLAACLEDKVTCNAQDASEAPFASGWLSTTRYATHTQTTVAPGSIGTFTYNVAVPSGQAAGTYRFNGALVLSSTGADIHNEGYYQDVTVPTATGSCTPTAITTSPSFASNQVGVTHTQTATVTCDPPSGSTTRPASVGTQVTFVVDAATTDTGNADQTLTATTDANGIATVTWTRSNPGTDSIAAYPTSTPAVRGTATKRWTVAASIISCTPTTDATQLNSTGRSYTVTLKNPTTGAAATSTAVDVTIGTRMSTGSGSINGAAILTTSGQVGTTVTTVTTDSAGSAGFTVTGSDSVVDPVVFVETATFGGTEDNSLAATEFRADCGNTTFSVSKATFVVTPDDTATMALNGQRVFTVTATDQFGATFTGTADISFNELTDASSTTTTTAVVSWVDTDTSRSTTASSGCATASSGTTSVNAQRTQVALVNGAATFAVCATAATTATPIVWQDLTSDDNVVQTDEPQDTGGATTWATASLTSATISPTSATNPVSSDNPSTQEGSPGEETFTFTLRDQSGNAVNPSATQTVIFTVRNTGSATAYIINCDGTAATTAIAAGATNNTACNPTITTGETAATIVVDSPNATSLEITGSLQTNAAITATGTKTWVVPTAEPTASGATVTGTVTAVDKTADWYLLSTGAGTYQITYEPGDSYIIAGTTTTQATFESALSVNDVVKFTAGTTDSHEITTNN